MERATKLQMRTAEDFKLRNAVQKIVSNTPLANFGNVKVRFADNEHDALIMRANSPADAVRLIAGLREKGYPAHGFTYDALKVGVLF